VFTPIISTVIAIKLMTSLDDTRWNPLDVGNAEELGDSLRNSFDQFENGDDDNVEDNLDTNIAAPDEVVLTVANTETNPDPEHEPNQEIDIEIGDKN
jgi:hypothetical protein